MVYLQREGKIIWGNNMAKTNLIPRSLKLKKGGGVGKWKDQQNMAKAGGVWLHPAVFCWDRKKIYGPQ